MPWGRGLSCFLSISGDGAEGKASQLDRMRELAGDMDGRQEVSDDRDGNTKMVLDVAIESIGTSLEQPRDT